MEETWLEVKKCRDPSHISEMICSYHTHHNLVGFQEHLLPHSCHVCFDPSFKAATQMTGVAEAVQDWVRNS